MSITLPNDMDWTEITRKGQPELERLLASNRERLRSLRFAVSQGQHKDVRDLRELKHDIARLMTKLRQLKTVKPTA